VPEDGIYQWSQAERGKLGGQTKIPHIEPTPDSSMIASLCDFHGHLNYLSPGKKRVTSFKKAFPQAVS